MGDTINWGFFKRHFWGELLRYQHHIWEVPRLDANLIGKIYLPRLIVPAAAVVVAFVDFLFGFGIMVGLALVLAL